MPVSDQQLEDSAPRQKRDPRDEEIRRLREKLDEARGACEEIARKKKLDAVAAASMQAIARTTLARLEEGLLRAPKGKQEGEWVMVPREPTEEMIEAHFAAHASAKAVFADVADIWRAMLDAAPKHAPASSFEAGVEALETFLRQLLKGEFSCLHITMNDECAVNYMTVKQWIEEGPSDGNDDWLSEEEKQNAIATNRMWSIQYYPDTPVGFYRVSASTLLACVRSLSPQQGG